MSERITDERIAELLEFFGSIAPLDWQMTGANAGYALKRDVVRALDALVAERKRVVRLRAALISIADEDGWLCTTDVGALVWISRDDPTRAVVIASHDDGPWVMA